MTDLIDDATADLYLTEIDKVTGDDRLKMANALEKYADSLAEKRRQQTDEHFSKLFTDEAYFEQEKAANTAVQESIDPDQTAKSAAIGAWLEHHNGRPIDPMSYQVERDAFAMANYGKKNLDDNQLFDFIRGEYNTQKKKTEAINDLQMQVAAKALSDAHLDSNRPFFDGITNEFNQWKAKYPELVDGKNDAAFLSQGYKLYYDVFNDIESVRGKASKALSTLTAYTQGNATDEDMQSLANDFVGAPPEDRQKIYKYVTLAAQAGQIDRAGIEQFAINMGQAFTRGFDFVPQGTLQMQEAGVNNWLESIRNGTQIWVPADGDLTKAVVGNAPAGVESDAWRQATVPEAETLIQSGQNVRESFKVVRELRNVAKTGVDPIRPVMEKGSVMGAVEGGAYGVAGSIGFLGATAINPFLGVAAYQANEYDRIRLENPDMDIRAAQGLALVEGTWQAALDRVQLATLSGKLPVLGRFLGNIENNGIRRTLKVGASVAEQFGQELAQDTGTIVIDNIAAALREDMPDKDFAAEMAKYGEQIPETLAASVMFGLVGGGFATAADLGVTEQQMKIVGINDKKIARIKQATSPEEADALIQSALESRTSEDIEAGKTYARQVFNEAQNPSPESPRISLVAGQDGTDEYLVTAPDGSEMLRTKSQQAAMEAVTQHGHAQLLNRQFEALYEPEELRQMISDLSNQWTSQASKNTLVMESEGMNAQQELEQLQAAGNASQIQELHNRIANSPMKDTPYEQINILGKASVDDVAEMVFQPLIKINPNTRPENLREEIHHIGVKVAIKNGSVTLDTLRGWLDATEKALPGTFQNLVRDSEGDIVESLAQVQAAYENGKINADEETKLPPSFIGYIKNMMRTLAEVLRRAVALRGAFKDGALPAEYETFLADSVGLNQQARVDTARERAGGELTQGLFNYSIGQRVLTDTVPFKGWFGDWKVDPTTASKVVDSDGKPMVVYHGTQRPDRVGDRFRKSRATSGPMAFFTNDPAIASSYSTNKRDTSAEMPSDYAEWFKYKGKGMRSPVAIDRAWWNLSPEERAAVNERIYTIGYSDWDAGEGPIVGNSQSIIPRDSIDYELRQARGNGLRALVEMWLSSGSLFNQEEKFLEVLQAAGVKGATLDDPNAARSAVYPVYLSIKNPLDTASIPGDVVSALEQAGKRKRAKQSAGKNPDGWDKNTISGNDWMAALKEDMAKGTTHAWTRIPDWVTETLSSLGYDGIKDTGGKNGGVQHQVWIPFNETQVKSATGNRGTFDPTSANINYSIGKIEAPSKDYFSKPDKDFVLGQLSPLVLEATGKSDKPVVLKVSVVGKNKSAHGEIPDSESAKILQEAISSPDLLILDQPAKRPNNWHFVRFDKSNQAVLVEMEDTKDTHQIVGWMAMRDNSIAQKIERAKKEGGRVLITGNDPRSDGLSDRLLGPRLKKALDSVAVKFEPKNYSIASQSEIDRVNRALGGMNRGPDERLKVYQRAKQKFSKVMAWNSDELAAMADTGSDDSQIRRTQILQGLGELDGIMSVLPPEVRGRVGGYTKLAGIAPHDVFKDGVKISEVSGMNGAIISAWMREGQNIGQAGKQVSLPLGYTATENLSTKRADKAIADFFRDRIKKIDTELEKVLVREYTEAIAKAVKQSRPKAGDNNVRKSTLGPEKQKLADMVQRATMMDEDAVSERMLQLEQTMAISENSADMVEEWGILNQFGDLKNRNSETLAQAYEWFKDQLKLGREAWRIKEEARIAENRERAKKTVEWVGEATRSDDFKNKTFMDRVSDWANHALLDHASFEQFVTALFPPDVAADFSTRLRKADVAAQKAEIDQREGILNALREGAKNAGISAGRALEMLKTEAPNSVRYLQGRKVKNTEFTIEQAEKVVRGEIDRSDLTDADIKNLSDELAALPADTRKENITLKQVVYPGKEVRLPMTRGKAIQLLLSWNQPDVQDKMRREGWNDDSIIDLRKLTSDPVSESMIAYAQELYGKGASIVNPVYSRMFGMNMPQVKNYAPTRFKHSEDVPDIGLDGVPVSKGSTPSFAKSRVSHSSEIAAEDALSVMQQHILTQAHWVNFAELAREFRSLLNNKDVRDAIKKKHGDNVLKLAGLWADQLEQRGGNQSRGAAWANAILGSVIGGQSVASLGFNLKTLAMQLDNAVRFGLALDMKQVVTAMQSPDQLIQDIKTVFESDALQTRLRGGATAESRFLFEKYGGRPGKAAKIAETSMSLINWMDTATTSFSAAIVYRANLKEALAAGMPEPLARETALDAAAAAIYRFAQPVSFGQKSNVENSGNIYTKAFFLFMSDPRLKTSIMADAIRGLVTGRGDKWTHVRRIIAVELMAALSHVVASSYRDAFTDDDDEDIWTLGGWVRALALAPLQGYLFFGTMFDSVLSQLSGAGWFAPTQNPLISVGQSGLRALKNADDILAFDDPDALLKEWAAIARTLAVAPPMAAPAVLLNMVKPVVGLYQNATTEE